jgi:hypothetical protein
MRRFSTDFDSLESQSFVLVETRTNVCDASHHRKLGREFGTIVL